MPTGDSGFNFALRIIAEISNKYNIIAQEIAVTVICSPRIFSGASQVQSTLNQLATDLRSYQQSAYDADYTTSRLVMFSMNLNDIATVASRTQVLYIQSLKDQVMQGLMLMYSPGRGRRLLDSNPCSDFPTLYSANIVGFVDLLVLLTAAAPQDASASRLCSSAQQSISCYLQSGSELGVIAQDVDNTAFQMFKTMANCFNSTNITVLYESLQALSILSMKDKNSADSMLDLKYKGLTMITKRYVVSDLSTKNLTINSQINITIPPYLALSLPNDASFDAFVIAMGMARNPYRSSKSQPVYGPIAEVNIRNSFQQSEILSSSQLASSVANVSNIPVKNLAVPIVIEFRLDTKPPLSYNSGTKVFNASACNFYNTSSEMWIPFGPNFAADCEPLCPWTQGTPPSKDLSKLTCPTSHLTAFSPVQTPVGCDFVPSLTPKQTDICCLCDGIGDSCCDWRRITSANNLAAQQFPCPATDDGQGLDRCLVCQRQLNIAITRPFISLQFKKFSGICDYQGIPCTGDMIPNACGVCDLPSNELQRNPNSGLCDCDPNPKLPTEPGGGKVLDRCGICNGGNQSMDDCGSNPAIPAYDNLGLFQVCHSGGRGKAQVPRWNMACTGCDNITRPDLPFNISRRPFPGGVQIDRCGICGGDNSACFGCDGVPGSSKKVDFCRVCGGSNISCIGCDGIPNPTPTVLDRCGTCGGSNYGACDVTITQEFSQILTLSMLSQNLGGTRQQLLQVCYRDILIHGFILPMLGILMIWEFTNGLTSFD